VTAAPNSTAFGAAVTFRDGGSSTIIGGCLSYLSPAHREAHVISARRPWSADRLYFLVPSIDDGYGICRSIVTLANHFAGRHEVEIISLQRRRDRPAFEVDDRVRLIYLDDVRRIGSPGRSRLRAALDGRPSRLVPRGSALDGSALSDLLLRRALRSLPPGILISTDASLHPAVARFAPRHLITIAQEHLSIAGRRATPGLQRIIVASGRSIDGLVTLTMPDRDAYRLALADVGTLVEAIPNAVPWPIERFVTPQAKVVVSAGRLEPVKGFDRLIEAYETVAHANPDWQFDIYGRGTQHNRLERAIAERGLTGRVRLRGYAPRFAEILSSASIFSLASHHEGLPMVLLEAMSKGLPVVTFDNSPGSAALVNDGRNGWLVEDGDVSAFSTGLFELIKDSDLRLRMGAAAHAVARQYEIGAVADRWEAMFARLIERRARH
jgi:glycosyltransferase involved in cell wall biosynthesis